MSRAYAAKALTRNLLSHAGLRAYRRRDVLARLLHQHSVNLLLDVGANNGQFGRRVRAMGYRGRIVSFEPLTRPFAKLRANARTFSNWTVLQMALGDTDETREINVAGNQQSSSFLDMLPEHSRAEPRSAYIGKEQVVVKPLDSIFGDFHGPGDRCFLKIDVQGFEDVVLRGAERSLASCLGIQMELSVVPMYQNGPLLSGMMSKLAGLGFSLMDLQPVFSDPHSGKLLQLDGTFFRC